MIACMLSHLRVLFLIEIPQTVVKILALVRQINLHIEIAFQIRNSEQIHLVAFIYLVMIFLLHHHHL